MHEHFTSHQGTPEAVHLPDSAQGCRERMAALQGEIASIRIQIATTDIRRQSEKKTLDAAWFHRAKTAQCQVLRNPQATRKRLDQHTLGKSV